MQTPEQFERSWKLGKSAPLQPALTPEQREAVRWALNRLHFTYEQSKRAIEYGVFTGVAQENVKQYETLKTI